MDKSSGMGFWKTLSDEELVIVISSPHAYRSSERAFAAQEFAERLLNNESNTNYEDYRLDRPDSIST